MKSKLLKPSNIILTILLLTAAVIIKILLNNGIFLDTESYVVQMPTRDEMNVIYSEIIDHNAEMLEHPAEYGAEFCYNYVSVKEDETVHNQVLNELQNLSDEICINAENDYEKVKSISYWVAENIYYNHVAADSAVTLETISLENVLATQTATCAGYSNLFSALCDMQGIYCVNLRGGTHGEIDTAEYLINAPMNHEWNAVMIDNEWIHVDVTWLSNNKYTENGFEKSDTMDEQYFDMSFEKMCYEHRIDLIDHRDFNSSVSTFKQK